jgi:hypothetical protein
VNLGNTGNGFDFLIDPYRYGGIPRSVTSTPYPVLADDEINGVVEGAFDIDVFGVLEEFTASSEALSGEIRDTLIRVYVGPDSLDSDSAVALSGSIAAIRKSFDAGFDEFDSVTSRAADGQMRAILIRTYVDEGLPDWLNSIHARATGGTLS